MTITRLTSFLSRIVWDTRKPNSQPRRKLDISRVNARFGFDAHTLFEAGPQKTIGWYCKHGL